ncbi:ParB/RepB/Spo0J family partition protein [Nitratireductor sp. OM-1]|uniref:ParB/RepB/Spo0J family partition protein n=1 Tax=Nitratireductor sp. OM-1 TaxID=1756988 RepID=UPI000DDF1D66|nr:ParB/RepB/Spo0J family partition protein [Nitratireductor sp. OM-1]
MALNLKKKKPQSAAKDAKLIAQPDGADETIDFRIVPIDDIEPNEYNPNDMEAEFFEAIVQQVKEEGMNQPILCRANPEKEGKFLIVDGEHRWRASKVAGKKVIPIIVVPFDAKQAKVRTLSMNNLRGQNIPIKLARLLVDLHKEYSANEIRAMTGIGEDEQTSVLSLLKVPDFNPSDGIKMTAQDVERPISVSLLLLPDEHTAYTTAMKKAMKVAGDDVTALIGHEVASYDNAMKAAMGLAGAKLRNVALALICETFNQMPKDQQAEIAKAAHAKIYDKLANDAEAKETKKQAAAKKSG